MYVSAAFLEIRTYVGSKLMLSVRIMAHHYQQILNHLLQVFTQIDMNSCCIQC